MVTKTPIRTRFVDVSSGIETILLEKGEEPSPSSHPKTIKTKMGLFRFGKKNKPRANIRPELSDMSNKLLLPSNHSHATKSSFSTRHFFCGLASGAASRSLRQEVVRMVNEVDDMDALIYRPHHSSSTNVYSPDKDVANAWMSMNTPSSGSSVQAAHGDHGKSMEGRTRPNPTFSERRRRHECREYQGLRRNQNAPHSKNSRLSHFPRNDPDRAAAAVAGFEAPHALSLFGPPQPENHSTVASQSRRVRITKASSRPCRKMSDKWKSAVDPKSGRTYYYNTETRETQWRKPMELATASEREEMAQKEQKQKDFFASMEANILKSMAAGLTPGTPAKKTSLEPKEDDDDDVKARPAPVRRGVSSSSSIPRPGADSLVRTISTMDDTLLRDIIHRQPSVRAMNNDDKSDPNRQPSRTPSLKLDNLAPVKEELLEGSMSYLETSSAELNLSMAQMAQMERSSSDFDFMSEHESEALSRLAKTAKEMSQISELIYSDEEEEEEGDSSEQTEIHFNPMDSSEKTKAGFEPMDSPFHRMSLDSTPKTGFQPKDAPFNPQRMSLGTTERNDLLGEEDSPFQFSPEPEPKKKQEEAKEIYFSPEEPAPKNPLSEEPAIKRASLPPELLNDAPALLEKPGMTRRNTCGTLYVGSTLSAPDKDATIKCVCGVVRAHIINAIQEGHAPKSEKWSLFNDRAAGGQKPPTGPEDLRLMRMRLASSQQEPVPSLDEITNFYRGIFRKAQMETDCIIMSLIYVERLIKKTHGELRPRPENWRSLLFSCMVLSSKVWDDLSMWNADFSQTCPKGVQFPLRRINELEVAVLDALKYKVKVQAGEYAKYYFVLRSMLIKSGLGGDDMNNMSPLDVQGAQKLEQASTSFQSMAATKLRVARHNSLRSKSMGDAEKAKLLQGVPGRGQNVKVGLEHMMKM